MNWLCFFLLFVGQAFGDDMASLQKSYNEALSAARGIDIKSLPGFQEGPPPEAALSGSGNLEGAIQERLLSEDPAVQFMNKTTQERPYFQIGVTDPMLSNAKEAIKDPAAYIQSGTFTVTEEKTEEVLCEEGRGGSKTQCTEEPWMEIKKLPGKHKLTLHFHGYEYYGYIIQADIFQTGRGCNNAASSGWKANHWAEIVEGAPFPREKRHLITGVKATVREVRNAPNPSQSSKKLTGFWQHFSYDQQGNVSLGSPHNIHGVFDGYVDVEIDYEPWPEITFKTETQPAYLREEEVKVHLQHRQNWSYHIGYDLLTNKVFSDSGKGSPGIIKGAILKEKIPQIKEIRVSQVTNTLDGQPADKSRDFPENFDKKTGKLWTGSPYGHSYGRDVTWDSYIDFVVVYEEPEKKIVKGNGCQHLQEKVRQGQCKVSNQTILEGPGTKEIEGEKITQDWWRRRLTFECFGNSTSTCKPLRDKGCYQIKSACKTKQGDACILWEQTYLCTTQKKTKTVQMQGEPLSGAGTIGPYESNKDMNDAVAKLQILKEVQDDIRGSQDGLPSVFKGGEGKCTIAFAGFKNCCFKSGGWGVDMNLAGCTGDEQNLALKRGKDLCVEIGTYCAEKKPVIGCIKKKKSYCCFPSKLSRIVHEQGRSQLNIGWGEPKHPNCRGLTVEELAKIDFDKLDLSEMVSDIQKRMKSIEASTLQHRLTDRVTGMTEPFKMDPFKKGEKNL